MAKIVSLREKKIIQTLSNNKERFVDSHLVLDRYDGTLAIAFVPPEGHKAIFRFTKRQVDELREWLNREAA